MAIDPRLIKRVESGFTSARAAGADLLRESDPPTAIITVQDELGFGTMAAITDLGLQPGSDVESLGLMTARLPPMSDLGHDRPPAFRGSCRDSRQPAGLSLDRPRPSPARPCSCRNSWSGVPPLDGPMTLSLLDAASDISTWQIVEERFVPSLAPGTVGIHDCEWLPDTRGSFEEGRRVRSGPPSSRVCS